jgi:hypothetical protein
MFTLHALNLPDTLTPAEWTAIHRDIIVCKKAATKWLQQSRDYSTGRWGVEFCADTEAQLELDLGLNLPDAKPALNPQDKSRAIVTIEGISQKFILWQRKMDEEVTTWDSARLNAALNLLEPMEKEAQRLRNLLTRNDGNPTN